MNRVTAIDIGYRVVQMLEADERFAETIKRIRADDREHELVEEIADEAQKADE